MTAHCTRSRPWSSQLRGFGAVAADLVLAGGCAGCGAAWTMWCDDCAEALGGDPFVAWPSPTPRGLPVPYAVAPYAGVVRSALLAHKEDGRLALARPLGVALAATVRAAVGSAGPAPGTEPRRPVVLGLVPAPSHRAAIRRRGHDATLRLARVAAATLRRDGVVVRVLPVLAPARPLADQSGLTATARQANLDGALRVPARLRRLVAGFPVLVVDDLITTGATLTESARALSAAGARVLATATVAATVRCRPYVSAEPSDVVGRCG